MIVQAIRSLLFYLLFLGQTILLALLLGTIALCLRKDRPAPPVLWAIGRYWGNSNLALLRFLVGIRSDVEGHENIPKRQLMDIPFFGWAAKAMNTISVDRKLGGEAIPAMLAEAREKLARQSQVIIFPEGTRKAPLAPADYRFGVTRLYLALGVPVVPVAVNSGFFWGRNSLVLWPGTARARFLPAIPAGLDGNEFHARLTATIEAETAALALRAYRDGLARPIPPELRAKLEALAAAAADTTTY
jgi:1-acyl-sn-glycerol-3-phosphate acyltransferase